MTFTSSHNRVETLYETYMTEIKGTKFTPREADILACVLHNRGEKKIAAILSVSPRTVGAHVYNIMNKLGVNSKDQIIDFIEKSGKLPVFREYYLHLSLKANFGLILAKIAGRVNKTPLIFYCQRAEALSINEAFFQSIKKHLQLANISLQELDANKIENLPLFDLARIKEEDYYHTMLEQLGELINSPLLTSLTVEFYDAYDKIKEVFQGKRDISGDVGSPISPAVLFPKHRNKILALTAIILILIPLFFYITNLPSFNKENTDGLKMPQVVKDLEELIVALQNEKFSADNVTPEQAKHNHNLIKKVEKILEFQNTNEVQKYFANTAMSSDFLVNYLYNIQSLSTYYLYNKYNASEARKILLHGKALVENYVNSRSIVKSDFSQLSNAEIYSELQIANDLPQLYTRILYSLGRTYIYEGSNLMEGKKYLEQVKYLGRKLQLFEGYLSESCGTLIINKELAEIDIQRGNIPLAKNSLEEVIKTYTLLRADSNSYINNYKPAETKQQRVVPKDHTYTFFDCGTRIIASYAMLLSISKDSKEIEGYIVNLERQLQGNDNTPGVLGLINKISPKKVADLYNVLGSMILKFYTLKNQHNLKVEDENLRAYIAKAIGIKSTLHLELAEALFEAAKNISRNSDFTKADSWQGLSRVYQLKLKHDGHSYMEPEKIELQNNLKFASSKAEMINKSLNRKAKPSVLQD